MKPARPHLGDKDVEEINGLIETWISVEKRLVELTGGEVDSVVSKDGRTLLFGQAQEQLRHQDAIKQAAMLNELRLLFDVVPAMIWFKDTQNGFLRVNQKVSETTGLRIDEIEGKTAYDIFPNEADAYFQDDLEVIQSGNPKLGIVENLPGPGGEPRWVQTNKVPVFDNDGKIIGLVALVHDITARMKSEAAVVESEKRYRSLFENILEGYAYCKTILEGDDLVDFTYEEVNGAFGVLTGLTDVVGRNICEILPGFRESNRAIMECYNRVVLTGSPEKIEAFVPELESWLSITVYSHERSHFVAVFDNITARKVSSSMLRDSEQRLALAKDAVNMGIWDWDIKRNRLEWDAKMYALYGIDQDTFGGAYESWQGGVHPEDVDRADAEIADALSNVKDFHTDYRIVLPGGEVRHVEAHALVLRDSEGKASRMIGVNVDISARKQAEESLRLLSSAIEQSKESILITDANLDQPGPAIVFVNPGFTQMTGFTAAEAIGQTPRILQGPQTDPEVLLRLRRCLERGEVFSGEAINYRKDGTPFWLEWQIAPLQDATGKTTHYVAIQRDVTERKEIETALRDSEERFREMLNNVELLAMILDLDGNVTFCNDLLLRVAGWDRSEVLGNNWFSMFVSPADQADLQAAFHMASTETTLPRYETTIVTRTGQKRDIVWNSSLLKDASGNLVGIANIGEDVTERKSLQEQLLQSQKMESLGSLAGGIAHDFNNLLTGILGYTELIQMDLPPGSQAQADLEEIRKSAMQAARMTKQLLSFARKDVVERQVVDLNDLVTNLEGMTRRLLGVDIRLSIHLQEDLGSVKLDPSQFEQLVLNLSVNARDAMPTEALW